MIGIGRGCENLVELSEKKVCGIRDVVSIARLVKDGLWGRREKRGRKHRVDLQLCELCFEFLDATLEGVDPLLLVADDLVLVLELLLELLDGRVLIVLADGLCLSELDNLRPRR